MFDVAPTELLLVMVVALVVIGPKDLPKAMRFVGKWAGKARGMARHFRSGLDTMMREAELEELEKQWRQQNEEIMRQFPSDSSLDIAPSNAASSKMPPSNMAAPSNTPESDNPDRDADFQAAQTGSTVAEDDGLTTDGQSDQAGSSGADADLPAETHKVPPRGSELP